MNKKLCYLVYLDGMKDHYYFLVGKASWDWINSPRPSFNQANAQEESIPQAVLDECTQPITEKEVHVTTGSCENDRAIHLMEGFELLASVKEVMDVCKKNGIELADEFQGMIY